MPLREYGVLKGRAIASRTGSGQSPHYQIHMIDETTHYRLAINVKSQLEPSTLYYLVDEEFSHPLTQIIGDLELGFHRLPSVPNSGALDFIRGNLFSPTDMKPLAHSVPGPDNDLNEKIDAFVSRAIQDEHATIYAFGERWGPEANKADKHFGFLPGNGVHDIHMNQGNTGRFQGDDGVWQDGGLVIQFPEIRDEGRLLFPEQWVGVFLAFQSQVWHTDDHTGHKLPGFPTGISGTAPTITPTTPTEVEIGGGGTAVEEDGRVCIIAALVNPQGDDVGQETVTLMNTTTEPIDLTGWAIADKFKQKAFLFNSINPGDTLRVFLSGEDAQLGNKGGIISLLDANGVKVHGVSYSKTQAQKQGRTIVFR